MGFFDNLWGFLGFKTRPLTTIQWLNPEYKPPQTLNQIISKKYEVQDEKLTMDASSPVFFQL